MNHGSLFSGIGGFDLAAQWMGWENVFQVEIDKFCQKVLEKNFPNVKRYGDIKEFDGTKYRGAIDVLSGGFPCQPYSSSGKRKGREDPREGWTENFRVVREIKPSFFIGENVTGIINMELEQILFDLDSEGYITETFIMPAYAIGVSHKRERVWICSYTEKIRREGILCDFNGVSNEKTESYSKERISLDSQRNPFLQFETSMGEPAIFGMADGISNRVDRLGACGNAIVPQVAYEIFKAIEEVKKKLEIT